MENFSKKIAFIHLINDKKATIVNSKKPIIPPLIKL